MELRHLRYFVAVAEEMNMHRAAERLHISQPPLSLAIRQLEDEVGAELFTREGRGIQITRAGQAYLEQARRILSASTGAAEQARLIHEGKTGILRIGFISSAISGILQTAVACFKKAYPDVQLEMNQSVNARIPHQLESGEIDIGILRLPEDLPHTMKIKVVARESWFAALPPGHSLTVKDSVSLTDLADERLLFYPRWNSPAGYDDVISMFREKGVVPNIYQEATEQMTIAGLVAAGMGVGVVPECMSKIKIPGVVHRPIRGTKNRISFGFVTLKDSDPLVSNFMKCVDKD